MSYPDVIFRDHFTGTDTKPPHRGKWMTFIAKSSGVTGTGYGNKYADILSNQLRLKCNGDGSGGAAVSSNAMTRAEFKIPFKVRFIVNIKHVAGQPPNHCAFEFNTPDIRDGLIQDTTLYGKWLVSIGAVDGNGGGKVYYWEMTVIKDGIQQATVRSADNAWAASTDYEVTIELTRSGQYDSIDVIIKRVSDSVIMWDPSAQLFDPGRYGTLRHRFFALTGENYTPYTEFEVDDYIVFGTKAKKPRVFATVKSGPGYSQWTTPSAVAASSESGSIDYNPNFDSFQDPDTDWNNEANAYDRNDGTSSTSDSITANTWSGYLELYRGTAVKANKLWWKVGRSTYGGYNGTLQVHIDGLWETVKSWSSYWPAASPANEYLTFSEGSVDGVRFRHKTGASAGSFSIYEMRLYLDAPASETIDNDTVETSKWQPWPANEAVAWIYWDSGGQRWLKGIRIYWPADANYRPTEYKLQRSTDASAWTDIATYSSEPGSGWEEYAWADKLSLFRYVRLLVTTHGASGTWVIEADWKDGHETIVDVSDDVIDGSVEHRDGSYPSGNITLRNQGNKSSESVVEIIGELEIRAGWDHILWLLFRGFIEAPVRRYPPALLSIESSKGYAKRLDMREMAGKNFSSQTSGAIVKDVVGSFFSGVFTTDHVGDGATLSIDPADDELAGDFLRSLAEKNGFVLYVDYNKDLHFVDPVNEQSQANLNIETPDDVIRIENRLVDEIINKYTQKGSGSLSNTQQDATSQSSYWLRERTFTDLTLTDAAAVQAAAQKGLARSKDPLEEIPIDLPEVFCIELYDVLVVTCSHVGLNDKLGVVKHVRYSFGPNGLRTHIGLSYRGFSLSDIIAEHERKLLGEA